MRTLRGMYSKGGGGVMVIKQHNCPKCGKDMLYVPSQQLYFCHHCKWSVPDFVDSFLKGFAKP